MNEQVTPSHYKWFEEKFGIESRKIVEQFTFNIGSAMKYLIRHGRKKSMSMDDRMKAIDDLQKARNFITYEIERLGQADYFGKEKKNTSDTSDGSMYVVTKS